MTTNELAPIANKPLARFLGEQKAALESALSNKPLVFAEFAIALDNACAQDEKLVECVQKNPQSVKNAILTAAMLGLRPGPVHKHFALSCFNVQGKPTCVGMVEWRGYVDLANQAGELETAIVTDVVYEYEVKPPKGQAKRFWYDRMTGQITHDIDWDDENADKRTPDKLVAVYATCKVKGRSSWATVLLRREDVHKRREASASWRKKGDKSLWGTDPIAMWKKSAVKALCDSGKIPMSKNTLAQLNETEAKSEEVVAETIKPADATVRPTVFHGNQPPTMAKAGDIWIDLTEDEGSKFRKLAGTGEFVEGCSEDEYDYAFQVVCERVKRVARDRSTNAEKLFGLLQKIGKTEKLPAKLSDASLGTLCRAFEHLSTEGA